MWGESEAKASDSYVVEIPSFRIISHMVR